MIEIAEKMTDKKNLDNVIIGPWSTKFKSELGQPWEQIEKQKKESTQKKIAEKLAKVDAMTESLMVAMIYGMQEDGIDIADDDYITDIGLVAETVKSCLFRQMDYPHILQELTDMAMIRGEVDNEFGEKVRYSNIDTSFLMDIVDAGYNLKQAEEMLDDNDTAESEGKDIYSGAYSEEDLISDEFPGLPKGVVGIITDENDDDEKDD
jgi:hypothetical protein